MRTAKIIIGVIIVIASLNSLIKLVKTSSGPELIGVLIGAAIFLTVGIWLIVSGASKKRQ